MTDNQIIKLSPLMGYSQLVLAQANSLLAKKINIKDHSTGKSCAYIDGRPSHPSVRFEIFEPVAHPHETPYLAEMLVCEVCENEIEEELYDKYF